MSSSAPRIESRHLAGLVALVMAGIVALSGCGSVYEVPLPGGAKVGENPITVHVEFRDVLDLVPQSTVKVDDVTVGRVTSVRLKGYHADVTLLLPRTIDLPDNARAEIRQTSLLGEKFVSLGEPVDEPASGKLSDGDVIPLGRSSRNPEVEEVLGALSLLLNGGGVGQLKIISEELNNALGGREDEVRSVLTQVHVFMGQLDANKAGIVRSIESLNRLAIQLKEQDGSIKSALDNLPAALKSIDSQRADLVKMLKALDRLSGVGVRVIKASKTSTINSLRSLAPVLDKLADAGSSLPDSLQVFLTYPFVDAAVGRNPQVARNLHMGDYTNLNARLDINVTSPPVLPTLPTILPTTLPSPIVDACIAVKKQVSAAAGRAVKGLPTPPFTKKQKAAIKKRIVRRVMASIDCKNPGNIPAKVAKALAQILKDGIPGVPLPHITKLPSIPGATLPSLPGGLPKLPRAGTAFDRAVDPGTVDVFNGPAGAAAEIGYNSTLAALLLQGVQDR